MPPIEIERKFLIRFPEVNKLCENAACSVKKISQTYLAAEKGVTRRVRKVECGGKTEYIFTEKRRISPLSCFEDEKNITVEEYTSLLSNADRLRKTVFKTRIAFPFENHTIEIDLYDFWQEFAILEIELDDESESIEIPEHITIIKEVSADKRFKNVNLALAHDFDPLS